MVDEGSEVSTISMQRHLIVSILQVYGWKHLSAPQLMEHLFSVRQGVAINNHCLIRLL